jgi:hypothetical protein
MNVQEAQERVNALFQRSRDMENAYQQARRARQASGEAVDVRIEGLDEILGRFGQAAPHLRQIAAATPELAPVLASPALEAAYRGGNPMTFSHTFNDLLGRAGLSVQTYGGALSTVAQNLPVPPTLRPAVSGLHQLGRGLGQVAGALPQDHPARRHATVLGAGLVHLATIGGIGGAGYLGVSTYGPVISNGISSVVNSMKSLSPFGSESGSSKTVEGELIGSQSGYMSSLGDTPPGSPEGSASGSVARVSASKSRRGLQPATESPGVSKLAGRPFAFHADGPPPMESLGKLYKSVHDGIMDFRLVPDDQKNITELLKLLTERDNISVQLTQRITEELEDNILSSLKRRYTISLLDTIKASEFKTSSMRKRALSRVGYRPQLVGYPSLLPGMYGSM